MENEFKNLQKKIKQLSKQPKKNYNELLIIYEQLAHNYYKLKNDIKKY
jgi:hypothetical protein